MSRPATDPRLAAVKRLVLVTQDLLRRQRYENYADLLEDVKCRCARLGLDYSPEMVGDALKRLGKGDLLGVLEQPKAPHPSAREVDVRPVSAADASAILARLKAHVRGMRSLDQTSPRGRQ